MYAETRVVSILWILLSYYLFLLIIFLHEAIIIRLSYFFFRIYSTKFFLKAFRRLSSITFTSNKNLIKYTNKIFKYTIPMIYRIEPNRVWLYICYSRTYVYILYKKTSSACFPHFSMPPFPLINVQQSLVFVQN